ncbi:hypothetical protein ACHHYP_08330 [Achlya hypogyna]|uniref:Peroxisomal biogenesis factor 3 n=1 Tax=Achlya hypogyna TaxID=1202772 RepID=A0A1V9ZKN4_ACHHY|nr:hypothetical protein ACHHYP_08330 [Achlya hypogyna]
MWNELCSAKKSVARWAGNHKTLLVTTGVLVACGAGAYYGVKRVVREAESMMMEGQRELMARQRLQMHLARSQDECKDAFLRFVPSVKSRVYKLLDLEGIVASLKLLDKSDRDMRDAMIRTLLLVHCELLTLGRETFEKPKTETDGEKASTLEAHQRFLSSTLEYFFEKGLPQLTTEVEKRIGQHETMQAWIVKEKGSVAKGELLDLLQDLHSTCLPSTDGDLALWQSFLIYPDDVPMDAHPDGVLPLLNELWDIVDSPFFKAALQASIDKLFELVQADVIAALYPGEENRVTDVADVKHLPLAKVIPQLKVEVGRLLVASAKQSTLVAHWEALFTLESLQTLSESIFVQNEVPTTSSGGWI